MTGYLYNGSPRLEQVNAQIMADRAARGVSEADQAAIGGERGRGQCSSCGKSPRSNVHRRVCMDGQTKL